MMEKLRGCVKKSECPHKGRGTKNEKQQQTNGPHTSHHMMWSWNWIDSVWVHQKVYWSRSASGL